MQPNYINFLKKMSQSTEPTESLARGSLDIASSVVFFPRQQDLQFRPEDLQREEKEWNDKLSPEENLRKVLEKQDQEHLKQKFNEKFKKCFKQCKKLLNDNKNTPGGLVDRYRKSSSLAKKIYNLSKKSAKAGYVDMDESIENKMTKLFEKLETEVITTAIRVLMVYMCQEDAHIILAMKTPSRSSIDQCTKQVSCSCKSSLLTMKLTRKEIDSIMNLFFDIQKERSGLYAL
jgi:hypothetical protein